MQQPMITVLLLVLSNVFMTFAWYGHLKYGHGWPLWKAIVVSWAIALLEYCLAVPANRLGYGQFSGFQLKIIQEVVTLIVFIVFATTFLKEKLAWNYLVAFAFSAWPRSSPLRSRHPGLYWKRAHHDWRFWVGLGFMFAAITIFVLSDNLAFLPHG
jgi:uncharacterized protein